MGRPERRDVDYFPFYIKDGRTLFVLESKYGCKGSGFFTNVMRFLSRTPNHHFQIKTASDNMYFFATIKCDEESGMDMIKIMIETEKLDRVLWEQKKVVASQDYLNSIEDAYRKRTNNIITMKEIKAFYGITTGRNAITAGETPPSIESSGVSDAENPQRKEKKRKEEEIKTRFLDHVDLKDKEFETLKKKYGETRANRMVEVLNNYFVANTKRLKKYTSHYGAINSWVVGDVLEKMPMQEISQTNLIGKTICRDCKKPPPDGFLQDGVCNKCRKSFL